MFKEGCFYMEVKTCRFMAVIGSVKKIYYPFESNSKNLIAQHDNGTVSPICSHDRLIRGCGEGASENWVEITEVEWLERLKELQELHNREIKR